MLLLDTHIWIWYAEGNQELNTKARTAIDQAIKERQIYLSAISLWELAMLNKKQRLSMTIPCDEWIKKSIAECYLQVVPISPDIAVESCQLPGEFNSDPADCMIVATARVEDLRIVSRDRRILDYEYVAKMSG